MSRYILPSVFVRASGEALSPEEEVGALLTLTADRVRQAAARENEKRLSRARRYAVWAVGVVLLVAAALALLARSLGQTALWPWIAFGTILVLGQAAIFYRVRTRWIADWTSMARASITRLHRLYWPVDLLLLNDSNVVASDPASQSSEPLHTVSVPTPSNEVLETEFARMEQMFTTLLAHERAMQGAQPRATSWHPITPTPALEAEVGRLWRALRPDPTPRRSTVFGGSRVGWDSKREQADALREFSGVRQHLSGLVHALHRQTYDLIDHARRLLDARKKEVQQELADTRQQTFAVADDRLLPLAPGSALPYTLPEGVASVQQTMGKLLGDLEKAEAGTSDRLQQLAQDEEEAVAAAERVAARRRAALEEKKARLTALAEEAHHLVDELSEQGKVLMQAAERLEEGSRQLVHGPFAALHEDITQLKARLEQSLDEIPEVEIPPELRDIFPIIAEMRDAAGGAASSWQRLLREMPRRRQEVVQQGVLAERQTSLLLASGAVHPSAQVVLDSNRQAMESAAARLESWLQESRAPMADLERSVSRLTQYVSDLEEHTDNLSSSSRVLAQLAGVGSPEAVSLQDVSAATLAALEQALEDSQRYQRAAAALRSEAARGHQQRERVTTMLDEWAVLQQELLAEEKALEEEERRSVENVREEWRAKRERIDVPMSRFEPIRIHIERRLSEHAEALNSMGLIQDEQTLGWLDRLVTMMEQVIEGWGARLSGEGTGATSRIAALRQEAEHHLDLLEQHTMSLPVVAADAVAVRCLLPFYRVETRLHSEDTPSPFLIPPTSLRTTQEGAHEIDQLRFPLLSERLRAYVQTLSEAALPTDADANLSPALLEAAISQEVARVAESDPDLARLLRNSGSSLLTPAT